MLTLCGIPLSNYYNKVKLALLEKGLPFEEELVMTGSAAEPHLPETPLGKVPFLRTEQGALCESSAILEYLEAGWRATCIRRPSSAARSAKAHRTAPASCW